MERMIDTRRPSSPFDDGAAERLRRMGLLQERGKPDWESMAVLCCVYAGLLFDDMCDFYQDYEDVTTVLHRLLEAAEGATVKKRFLLICLQYDGIGRQLPDPIWWISGNPELTEVFADGFLQNLKRLCECS